MSQRPLDVLRRAIHLDHTRTGELFGRFRRAWVDGEAERAQHGFHRFRLAILRHLEWEEGALIGRFRDRALDRSEIDAVAGDCAAHRALRAAVRRIEALLLPERAQGGAVSDPPMLELVDDLDRTLVSHRALTETKLCDALGELITPDQCDEARRAIEGRTGDPE
jgi:hypothetical protein